MKKIILPLLSCLVLACSTDAEETIDDLTTDNLPNEESTNSLPEITSQQFLIAEHSPSGTSIGIITASDADNDQLTYSLESQVDISINENTGELFVGENLSLDFEASESIAVTASVFDGKATTESEITITVEDINEFEALSESQTEVVEHFKYITLFQDVTSPTQEIMRKWNDSMLLFLSGNITTEFRDDIEAIIAEFNTLTASGNFTISLVDTEAESNAKLYFGTKEEVEEVFPVMYDQIKDLNVDGYARSSFVGNFYNVTQIWVSSQRDVLFKHEMGHALGMGHSNICNTESPSVMCSSIADESSIIPLEQDVIKYFYHENMPSGLSAEEIEANVANLILLGE